MSENTNPTPSAASTQLSPKTIFYAQLLITVIGLGITATLMVTDHGNSAVYVPIMTSLLFSWTPSPSSASVSSDSSQKLESLLTEVQVVKSQVQGMSLPIRQATRVNPE